MSFKIEMPKIENKESDKIIESKNRAMFTNDFEKREGILAKVLVFTQVNQPVTITGLTNSLISYYKVDFSRSAVFRACDKLNKLGLLHKETSGNILVLQENERDSMQNHILAKHIRFLKELPQAFKKNYNDINYFWVANGEGKKYIEWNCKLLGFKVKN